MRGNININTTVGGLPAHSWVSMPTDPRDPPSASCRVCNVKRVDRPNSIVTAYSFDAVRWSVQEPDCLTPMGTEE